VRINLPRSVIMRIYIFISTYIVIFLLSVYRIVKFKFSIVRQHSLGRPKFAYSVFIRTSIHNKSISNGTLVTETRKLIVKFTKPVHVTKTQQVQISMSFNFIFFFVFWVLYILIDIKCYHFKIVFFRNIYLSFNFIGTIVLIIKLKSEIFKI